MILAIGLFAAIHPGRALTGPESEFSDLIVQKGQRRWWCCGRRARIKIDPDNGFVEYGTEISLGGREILLDHERRLDGEWCGDEQRHGRRGR